MFVIFKAKLCRGNVLSKCLFYEFRFALLEPEQIVRRGASLETTDLAQRGEAETGSKRILPKSGTDEIKLKTC